MKRGGYTYIVTNKNNTGLYIGVTSDLYRWINKHYTGVHPNAFIKKYNVSKLFFFEVYFRIEEAITREKQIKLG